LGLTLFPDLWICSVLDLFFEADGSVQLHICVKANTKR